MPEIHALFHSRVSFGNATRNQKRLRFRQPIEVAEDFSLPRPAADRVTTSNPDSHYQASGEGLRNTATACHIPEWRRRGAPAILHLFDEHPLRTGQACKSARPATPSLQSTSRFRTSSPLCGATSGSRSIHGKDGPRPTRRCDRTIAQECEFARLPANVYQEFGVHCTCHGPRKPARGDCHSLTGA